MAQTNLDELPALSSVHVLVVDDSPEIRMLLADVLEASGATVTVAETAEIALDRLERLRPNVLVSDLEMPGGDGYWLIGKVRELPPERGGATPAACLTGCSEPEDRASILRAGFQYHLSKPVDIRTLVGVVAILALPS
jgi:CheY-like chemotaxis protein